MFRTCPRKCLRDTCPCVNIGLPCADAFVKNECENYVFRDGDINHTESDYLLSDDENY